MIILVLFLEIVFVSGFAFWLVFLIYSELKGVSYVPTGSSDIEKILKEANLKPGQVFYDLGCGDGRILRWAVSRYRVRGAGVDVNPLLIVCAKFLTKIKNVKNIQWQQNDLLNADLSPADVVYFFLNPKLLEKLTPKLEKELKKGVLVISHGFEIHGFAGSLVKKIDDKKFPTYFYSK